MTESGRIRRGPPVGRHVAAVGVTLVVMLVFWWVHPRKGDAQALWNTVLADTSVVLLCLIFILGAVARYAPRLRRFVPWARELGIGMFVTASLHVAILLPHFGDGSNLFDQALGSVDGEQMWAAANWVGWVALAYAIVLAATSNDFSQRLLGRGWKFVQRQAYTLFVLAWLHTAGWLELIPGNFPKPAPWWFWVLTTLAVVAQFAGFAHTVRSPRGPSTQRPPPKARPVSSKAASVAASRWVAVTALWGLLVIGVYPLGLV